MPVAEPGGWGPELTSLAPPLARWDAGWYYSIATSGYRYDPAALQNSIGFYPLYPLAVRAISWLLKTPVFPTGMGLSLLCLLGALLLFASLVREREGDDAVPFAVASLLFFPAAFFFAAFYTESLFLAATVGAVWAARRRLWLISGFAGAAASLTRLNGALVVVPIAAYAWLEHRRGDSRQARFGALAAAIALAGACAYPFYLWQRWGDPLLYLHGQARGWSGLHFGRFWGAFAALGSVASPAAGLAEQSRLAIGMEGGALLLAILSLPWLLRRQWRPEGLYVAGTLVLLLGSGTLHSMHRYVAVLFPCFVWLGGFLRRRPPLAFAYALVGSAAGVILLARFVHWLYVG